MKKTFYITTTLPYVNAEAHLGHAMEFIRADVIARYKRLQGYEVFFNTGTDEHGTKVYRKAVEEGTDPKLYVDHYAEKFKTLLPLLGIMPEVHFIRTTDPDHKLSAQEFWKRCEASGDIYKKSYQIKYCVGCELEKTESELVNGRCPLHPTLDVEFINEENYFFRFSKYAKPLLEFYEKNSTFVIPDFRFNEIKAFVERGLEDFSISRLASKMPWGVPVPNDSEHVMYVWFDALVNYISAIGWPEDMKKFETWWPVTQYAGKDNLRQQSAMWQAMLMSAQLKPSAQIVINGFITGAGGVKMSKSLGNVVSPVELVKEYGTDALRYYVTRELLPFEDSSFTPDIFKESYNSSLVNGLGNLTSRIMKMATTNLDKPVDIGDIEFIPEYTKAFEVFNLKQATDIVWNLITLADQSIQQEKPFSVIKQDVEKGKVLIQKLVKNLAVIAYHLEPFLPETSKNIKALITENKMPDTPLFPRKD